MIKRFIKKIGRGIKKVGKAIGKPFKKLMKTKLGKVIGTIGMMMIGGWMLGGAKTFASGLFAGEGLTASFTNAMSNIGQSIGQSFTTITDGVKSMFSGGKPNPTNVDLAKTAEKISSDITKDITLGDKQKTLFDESFKDINKTLESSQELTKQALETTKGKLGIVGEESASGKIYTGDNLGETIKIDKINTNVELLKPANERQLQSLLDSRSADFMSKDGIALKENLGLDMELENSLKDFNKVDMTEKVNKNRFWDMSFKEIKDRTIGYKPLQSFEKLPGILREGTVGEGIALSQALSSPPDPYIQGSSDMSGAISSLSQNEERLYSNMNMTDFTNGSMSQVPSPSTMRNPLQSYINNIQNAGYIYDSTLLAVKPSAIVPS
tara:strand:+ start:236 stop:1378 length:1143 start_codon:yes stop_codon:yes gene_type:complete